MRYADLRKAITDAFNKGELRELCSDLSIDYESIPGEDEGKEIWVQKIILYFRQKKQLEGLIQALAKERPLVDWTNLLLVGQNSEVDCPYPGMLPFTGEDKYLFCGRDDEIADMLQRIRHQNFLLVVGSSGSGKSSLVKAGLLPRLFEGGVFRAGFWLTRILQPREHPMQELAKSLGQTSDWKGKCDQECIADLLKTNPSAQKLLLVIDQFEEAFFPQIDVAEQHEFIAAIMSVCGGEDCVVIITMRADYYDPLMNSALWELAEHQRIELVPLKDKALREAICKPAETVGVMVKPELVERLLADAKEQPGVQPLIQETLVQLWGHGQIDEITLEAYDAMSRDGRSGLAIALETVADGAIRRLIPFKLVGMAQRILLDLVQLGEPGLSQDTRRRQYLRDLRMVRNSHSALEFDKTLSELTQSRLVVQGSDPEHHAFVELSHDALLSGWQRLNRWLNDDRAKLYLHRQLRRDVQNWTKHNFDEGLLFGGSKLKDAVKYSQKPLEPLTPKEITFLDRGEALEAQRERTRYRGQIAGLAVGAGLGFGSLLAIDWVIRNSSGYLKSQLLQIAVGNTFMALSVGALVGTAIGLSLWVVKRRNWQSVITTTMISLLTGAIAFLVFFYLTQISTAARFSEMAFTQAKAGAFLGGVIGLAISFSNTKKRRLTVLPLAGAFALTLIYWVIGTDKSMLILYSLCGALLGAFLAMGYQATAVSTEGVHTQTTEDT